MYERDKRILNDLKRFRCMTRDDLAELHFKNLKRPVKCCNDVLKRLHRDGLVNVNKHTSPFTYFDVESKLKKNSQKVEHFLSIVQTYKDLRRWGTIQEFDVEPKIGCKGTVEPDIYMIWRGVPFFVEVQRCE